VEGLREDEGAEGGWFVVVARKESKRASKDEREG
jgi:hypothetical protein